ncbi:MAG: lycopene cyclase domain-containing protein, partial [archaeon]
MSEWTYAAYLALVLIGILCVGKVFPSRWSKKEWKAAGAAIAMAGSAFVVWDILAVEARHWSFDESLVLGLFLGNQPLEEILFFILVPF